VNILIKSHSVSNLLFSPGYKFDVSVDQVFAAIEIYCKFASLIYTYLNDQIFLAIQLQPLRSFLLLSSCVV
jgi:hypothetical protein